MQLLILGGTAFLGRAIATTAVEHGHTTTCLARGTAPTPDGTTFVAGDRDDADGLTAVAGRRWDAVIDVSRQPGQVRRATRTLRAWHWVFISSGNVYADFSTIEQDESAPVREALDVEVMRDLSVYGEAKVACEEAVRAGARSATIVRSGLIGGPGDVSGRSGYWPWRFAHPTGTDLIVPDDPGFPCAMIDVRDLATWVVLAAEHRHDGVFNVTGPTTGLSDVLASAAHVALSATRGRPVPATRPVAPGRLAELGVTPWMGPASMPLWIDDPAWRGFATMDCTRARSAGLVTRPLTETLCDALDYENGRTEPRQAGLTDEDERRVRAALVAAELAGTGGA